MTGAYIGRGCAVACQPVDNCRHRTPDIPTYFGARFADTFLQASMSSCFQGSGRLISVVGFAEMKVGWGGFGCVLVSGLWLGYFTGKYI